MEGLWTYVYYSYTGNDQKVTGHIKYADKPFESFTLKTNHPKTKSVKFVTGGNDFKRLPGLNGQFTRILFND